MFICSPQSCYDFSRLAVKRSGGRSWCLKESFQEVRSCRLHDSFTSEHALTFPILVPQKTCLVSCQQRAVCSFPGCSITGSSSTPCRWTLTRTAAFCTRRSRWAPTSLPMPPPGYVVSWKNSVCHNVAKGNSSKREFNNHSTNWR